MLYLNKNINNYYKTSNFFCCDSRLNFKYNCDFFYTKTLYPWFSKLVKYYSIFYFFFPSPVTTHIKTENYNYENPVNFYKSLRFKPGYQDIFRYYRRYWLMLTLRRKMRQHRTTRTIHNYSIGGTHAHTIYKIFEKKNQSYNEPSRRFLNWKYIV